MISGIGSARLSVLLDMRHPLAYLALQPTLELARSLELELNWLPIVVPPLRQPSLANPSDDRGLRHRRFRAEAIAREIETYAEAQGLLLREYYRDADPSALNLAWLWLRERHPSQLPSFLDAVFRAYWTLELSPDDPAAMARWIQSLTGDAREFRAWCSGDGAVHLAALAGELRDRGLSGTPCYVVEDEVFLGRQHLPMIRWILTGRSGPVPI